MLVHSMSRQLSVCHLNLILTRGSRDVWVPWEDGVSLGITPRCPWLSLHCKTNKCCNYVPLVLCCNNCAINNVIVNISSITFGIEWIRIHRSWFSFCIVSCDVFTWFIWSWSDSIALSSLVAGGGFWVCVLWCQAGVEGSNGCTVLMAIPALFRESSLSFSFIQKSRLLRLPNGSFGSQILFLK